jgi:DNA gyrase/topoisomerase IV subunit A
MITPEKIEDWLKEVEQRPESAPLIIQFIANRLRDLSTWNESLRAENIALIKGNRVEEYEQRIAHLEYQLDLLKRQRGGALPAGEGQAESSSLPIETTSMIVYNTLGNALRYPLAPGDMEGGKIIGRLRGDLASGGEPPRILALPSAEELLFVFTYGRVAAHPVESLPPVESGDAWDWEAAPVPEARRSKEALASLTPIARLALSEFFVQVSRRGYVKKILTSMAANILSQHYIGTGTTLPVDKVFETRLCGKDSRIVLVSHEGYLLCLDVGRLPFSVEEAMRLGATDHLVAALIADPGKTILVMTQIGKLVALSGEELEISSSLKSRGQVIFSSQRRASGVRVAGAAVVSETDWALALHADGQVTLHSVGSLLGRGTLPVEGELLAFTTFTA